MKVALLFPGQGSQAVGMGKALSEQSAAAADVFREADEVLGFSISTLCFTGPEETLRLTSNTQPAIFVASVAAWRAFESACPPPSFAAGHSLGEYSALVAAGAVSFRDALPVVRRRGVLMQESADRSGGNEAMAAVLGLDREPLRRVCAEAEAATGEVVDPANFNCPGQIVISGSRAGVQRAMELAKAAGAGKCIPLNVSGAFHSRLMRPAAEAFRSSLAALTLSAPRCPVVPNATGRPTTDPAEIAAALAAQVSSPVLWEDSMRAMEAGGASSYVEIGPGRVLSGFVKRIRRDAALLNVEDAESLEKASQALAAARA